MGTKTKIDWCDSTWSPITGCLHGCEYCYARGIAKRFEGGCLKADGSFSMPGVNSSFAVLGEKQLIAKLSEPIYKKENGKLKKAPYPYGFYPTLHEYRLNEYEHKKGRVIFVCSMADMFGRWVPDGWIEKVFEACDKAPQHTYLFLTKYPKRYEELARKGILRNRDNMWYGTSITGQKDAEARTWRMQQVNNYNLFVSIEPLLEYIEPETADYITDVFDWVIIGAETGRRKDTVVPEKEWINAIFYMCKKKDIPVFMKESLRYIADNELIQEWPFNKKGKL